MKPSDFLTNIVDLFAVLLPGAIFVFALYFIFLTPENFQAGDIFVKQLPLTIQGWLVLGAASYIFGSFIFFAGSLLDGKSYKWIQDKPYYHLKVKLLSKQNDQKMWEKAEIYRKEILDENDCPSPNIVKWVKANVYLFYPAAAAELHRFEANSKLFRSLSAAMLFLFIISLVKALWLFAFLCILTVPLFLFCYADHRYKYAELACIYLIAIHRKNISEQIKAK